MPDANTVFSSSAMDLVNERLESIPSPFLPNVPVSNGAIPETSLKPVAIIGFSIRFPEDATSADGFWDMLMEKKCVTRDWPRDRMNVDAFYDPDADRLDTCPARGGFFLKDNLGAFDAPFFSITAKDAAAMDPQQRGILETTYRALENSGVSLAHVSGSKTSVHTGSFSDDYKSLIGKDPELIPKYAATGLARTMLANRVSWFFNLTGPSIHMDSACSSSMMALDSACQGLQNGDSKMAIVAGANIVCSPDSMLLLSNMNFLSPDSRCFSFDDRANGYARGEGYGVIILKLLDDALKDKDTIRAVIRSTGSNQDGHTPGITQPSKEAQEMLIRDTYQKAGLDMNTTMFVEAHGTGTPVGDPIEASAIGSAFKAYRSPSDPLFIGAVKSNIGHLEGASGIAGLVKVILALEKGVIPPNVFERLNPKIDTDFLNIKFPAEPTPWPRSGLRRASVNSFGFGGSNSHVVLDDAYNFLLSRGLTGNHCTIESPPQIGTQSTNGGHKAFHSNGTTKDSSDIPTETPKLLVWSAADENALIRLIKLYEKHIKTVSPSTYDHYLYIKNLAYTLNMRRSSLPWRSFAVVDSTSDLSDVLRTVSKPIRSAEKNKLGYIFTGQGAQYAKMGIDLLVYPVFHASILRSDVYLKEFGCKWSVLNELLVDKETSKVNGPAYSQPLCTILQIALVDLLHSFGAKPSAVVGHSSGEIAAAYAIGGLSHKSACQVAYYRGKLTAKLSSSPTTKGAMIAVGLSKEAALSHIESFADGNDKVDISVGCINSPRNVTLTGHIDDIDALKMILEEQSVFVRKLQVDVAYHSHHMSAIADDYADSLRDLSQGDCPDSVTMISTVSGKAVPKKDLCKSGYWVQNLVSPVRFSEALSQITQRKGPRRLGSEKQVLNVDNLLEVGPHSALQSSTKDILQSTSSNDKITYNSVLTRFASGLSTVLQAVGQLHCLGYGVHVAIANEPDGSSGRTLRSLEDLPEYPFDHSQIYWHESRLSSTGHRFRSHKRLDLLGTPALDWNPLEARWRNSLRVTEIPWIEDHKVNGLAVYPAVGMLIMAIEGIRQLAPKGRSIKGYTIKDAEFSKPVPITAGPEGTETQLFIHTVQDAGDKHASWSHFRLCVLEDGQWAETCRGAIQAEYEEAGNEVSSTENLGRARGLSHEMHVLKERSKDCRRSMSSKDAYDHLASWGLSYGSSFQRLQNLHFDDKQVATGRIDLFQWKAVENSNHYQPHVIHPTSLDALGQLILLALSNGGRDVAPTAVPTRVSKIWLSDTGLSYPVATSVDAVGTAAYKGFRQVVASMFASAPATNNLLVSIENMEFTTIADRATNTNKQDVEANLFYNMEWKPSFYQPDPLAIWNYCESVRQVTSDQTSLYREIYFVIYGFFRRVIQTVDKDTTHLKPHLQKYIAWMKSQLEQARRGDLNHSRPEWASLADDETYFNAACQRIETTGEGKFLVTVGRSLPQILRGEVDALAVLSQDDLIQRHYEHITSELVCFGPIARYLEVLSHRNPQLVVLEIGAGTGSTSTQVLSALLKDGSTFGYSQYDFTDTSSVLFEAAGDRLRDHSSRMKFKTLDIEVDPMQQGFTAGSYDVVVASLVLHATKDLNNTLRNVRSLLKPGGSLVLLEIVAEDIRASFAFGLLPGWWLSNEGYREWSPCISTQQWDTVLQLNGFSRTNMEIADTEGAGCHAFSWLISTAIEVKPEPLTIEVSRSEDTPTVTILVTGNCNVQLRAASLLEKELATFGGFNCNVLSLKSWRPNDRDDEFVISLLEYGSPLLYSLTAEVFEELQILLTSIKSLLWVKGGGDPSRSHDIPEYGVADGFLRTLQSEFNEFHIVSLWLQDCGKTLDNQAKTIARLFSDHFSKSDPEIESEYVEKDGLLHIGRLIGAPMLNEDLFLRTKPQILKEKAFKSGPPLALRIGSPGFLDSFYFVEDDTVAKPVGPMEIEIEVKAVGINFVDLLTALGRVNQKVMGGECSGVVTRVGPGSEFSPGDRVCANTLNTFQTYSRSHDYCAVKLPEDMSFVEGASLPTVFVTAYHSLVYLAHIQPKQTILIHAGAGGTGGAAIQVAKHFKAEIFTTVGSEAKKKLIMELYDIPEDHIFYSRNLSFAAEVMHMTKGKGVDIILNSLAGESLISSWECIASFGHFIEIGKRDIHAHKDLPMFKFARNVSFSAVDAVAMINERPELIRRSLQPVLELMKSGVLQPVAPLHVHKISGLEDAFHYIQSGKNTGKTVIDVQPENEVLTLLDTVPTCCFSNDATYMIVGGLGGLGKIAARWLVGRGARNLILLSRSGPKSQESVALIEELQSTGARVMTPCCDVADSESLAAVISHCSEIMPPIKGCIQGAMVLRDAIFEKMTFEDWKTSISPKVIGSWNLHTLLPKDMDFFLLLSSLCGVIGNGSQANYSAGNTYMDALANYRTARGLKTVSLDLSWMESAGAVHESELLTRSMKAARYTIPISEACFSVILDKYCDPKLDVGSNVQIVVGLETPARMRAKNAEIPQWMSRKTFIHFDQLGFDHGDAQIGAGEKDKDYLELFQTLGSLAEAAQTVTEALVKRLSLALLMPVEDIDISKPLYGYGVDSLLAVELRNWFARELRADVTVFDIMGSANFEALGILAARRSAFKQSTWVDRID